MSDRQDGQLIVQLAQWGTSMHLMDAISTILSSDFDPQAATIDDPEVRTVLYFFETLGTLTKNGLLDQALALDWLWVSGAWSQVSAVAVREREARGVPALFENFEALAQAQG